MKFIALALKGPFASFGSGSKTAKVRETQFFPTKSALFGMLLAAAGKHGTVEEMKTLLENIQADAYDFQEKKEYLHDYQILGMGYDQNDWFGKKMIPMKYDGSCQGTNSCIKKTYLQNVKFGVILTVLDDSLAEDIARSLTHPTWPIFLGRKNCIPTCRILQGVFNSSEDALEQLKKFYENSPYSLVTERHLPINEYDESFFINDVPIKFANDDGSKCKQYASRKVYIKKLSE